MGHMEGSCPPLGKCKRGNHRLRTQTYNPRTQRHTLALEAIVFMTIATLAVAYFSSK